MSSPVSVSPLTRDSVVRNTTRVPSSLARMNVGTAPELPPAGPVETSETVPLLFS